jgi:hypothetical protein
MSLHECQRVISLFVPLRCTQHAIKVLASQVRLAGIQGGFVLGNLANQILFNVLFSILKKNIKVSL